MRDTYIRLTFLNPYQQFTRVTVTEVDYGHREIDLWKFLQLNFLEMVDVLAYKWLHKREIIYTYLDKKYGDIDYNPISYTETDLNLDNLVELVYEHQQAIETVFNKRCKYIVIGKDLHYRIIKEVRTNVNYLHFTIPHSYKAPLSHGYDNVFGGLEVIMVPWAKGIVVLPDLNK